MRSQSIRTRTAGLGAESVETKEVGGGGGVGGVVGVSTNYRSICHNMSLTFNVLMSIIE